MYIDGRCSGIYPYPDDWTDDLKEAIRKRDNFTCQVCKVEQEKSTKKFPVHHIDYIKENLDPVNLITLCLSCHSKTNYNRPFWIRYFTSPLRLVVNK